MQQLENAVETLSVRYQQPEIHMLLASVAFAAADRCEAVVAMDTCDRNVARQPNARSLNNVNAYISLVSLQ